MVDEFSSFARMPAPVMKEEDLVAICYETLVLFETAHKNIEFRMHSGHESLNFLCDRNQLMQAITNLLQNSVDSIRECMQLGKDHQVTVLLETKEAVGIRLTVLDSGNGLPDQRGNLTDPYVTTRERGSGLGLAIVKKIMEDHGGEVILSDKIKNGASVSLVFPEVVGKEKLETSAI